MTTESFNCWVYIPPKDILSNAPGFTSLYNAREVAFEETYADLVSKCLLPDLRAEPDGLLGTVLSRVRNSINGEVVIENENFFLKKRGKKTEFMLVAEGFRKLALLDVLIRNGTIAKGSTLLWDEPEANLNPKLLGVLIDCLLDLQRAGVQIFLATHHYQILKRLDLQKKEKDSVRYHSLYREGGKPDGRIRVNSVDELALVDPNPILDSYTEIYNKELERIL